jgi:3-(3-hydroxy-phenyl)propionate hydroxylase
LTKGRGAVAQQQAWRDRGSAAQYAGADPVVVVGAGPVGLTAAVALANRGLPVTVIEQAPGLGTDWRASTFHAATLELLDQLGVVEEMHARGLVVPRYQFRDRRQGLVAEFNFGMIAGETRFPYRLQLNQQRLVGMLLDRLDGRRRVSVRFGTRLAGLRQDDSGAGLLVESAGGQQWLRGSFVVGADGPDSTVRGQLGIAFEGMTYPQRFMIVTVAEQLDEVISDLAPVAYVADPREWLFFLRTRECWRVVLPIGPDETDAEAVDPVRIAAKLQAAAPAAGGYHVTDRQLYRVHQRVATSFVHGRVLLAGDAAHINSPLGGMGLNSGIHDAIDLSVRLARIWYDPAADRQAELAGYAEHRRRVALDYVQADTHRNTLMLSEQDEAARRRNRDQMAATAADPARAREWLLRASMIAALRSQGIGRVDHAAGTPAGTKGGSP